uniref:Uncharacterized protein n=1 Tax=Knipowitschia caucasica TaxID=637954 RepID=A0AAV2JSL9_KNICA
MSLRSHGTTFTSIHRSAYIPQYSGHSLTVTDAPRSARRRPVCRSASLLFGMGRTRPGAVDPWSRGSVAAYPAAELQPRPAAASPRRQGHALLLLLPVPLRTSASTHTRTGPPCASAEQEESHPSVKHGAMVGERREEQRGEDVRRREEERGREETRGGERTGGEKAR